MIIRKFISNITFKQHLSWMDFLALYITSVALSVTYCSRELVESPIHLLKMLKAHLAPVSHTKGHDKASVFNNLGMRKGCFCRTWWGPVKRGELYEALANLAERSDKTLADMSSWSFMFFHQQLAGGLLI